MSLSRRHSSGLRLTAVPLFVAAATAIVFWKCVHNGFVDMDDPECLIRASRGFGASSIRAMFTSFSLCTYSPLSLLSFSADFTLWGMNPFGYHLTSLLLHAANAVVFYFLCLEFLSLGGATKDDRPAAAAAALFFSLHPLRVQSVVWVAERRDVLCGFFFLLTLLLWMRSFRPGRLSGARGKAAALASYLLALLSKPAAVPLPFVLILLDFWPLRRPYASTLWKEKLPFLALSIAFAAVAAAGQSSGGAAVSVARAIPLQRANQIGLSLVYYLGKLLWPTNLSFYEWHWAPIRAAVIIGALATAALLGAVAWSRRLRAPLLCALIYQSLMIAPVSGFVTIGHEIVADRYSYLSGLAWALLFGAGLRILARRHQVVAFVFACTLLTALAAVTCAQISFWKDSVSLWRQDVRVDPATLGGRPNLAGALVASGRVGEAILYLEEHVRLNPEDSEVRRALEDLIAKTGTTFRDHAAFHEQLGLEFAARGEFDKAAWHFERGLRYDPDSDRLRAELEKARLGVRPLRATSEGGAR